MKKIICIVLAVLVLGVTLISCGKKANINPQQNNEQTLDTREYTDEELEEGLDYPGLEKLQEAEEKKEECAKIIKEKKLVEEREYKEDCEHVYTEFAFPIEGLEYVPVRKLCTKCGGCKIERYVPNDFKTETYEEGMNDFIEAIKNNN